jgi:arginine repressor
MGIHNFLGSVAGDDTAFLAMADDKSAKLLCAEIERILK